MNTDLNVQTHSLTDKHNYIVRRLARAESYHNNFNSAVGEVRLESFRYMMDGDVYICVASPECRYVLLKSMEEEIEREAKNMEVDINAARAELRTLKKDNMLYTVNAL